MSVRESRFTAPLSVVDASTATTAVDSTGRRTLTMDKLWSSTPATNMIGHHYVLFVDLNAIYPLLHVETGSWTEEGATSRCGQPIARVVVASMRSTHDAVHVRSTAENSSKKLVHVHGSFRYNP